MGLFSSDTENSSLTVVKTETTTNIRDVGLTGQNAVDLAATVGGTAVQLETLNAGTLAGITGILGDLITGVGSGARSLLASAEGAARQNIVSSEETATDIITGASNLVNQAAGDQTTKQRNQLIFTAVLVIGSIFAAGRFIK